MIPLVAPVSSKTLPQDPEGDPPANVWHLSSVNVAVAREKNPPLSGAGVLIGVLDTGIDSAHQEFAGKQITKSAQYFREFDTNGDPVQGTAHDSHDHGTHVCGIIAGKNVGVAPGAELAVAAVLTLMTEKGPLGSFAQILSGLNWLLESDFRGDSQNLGVDVINASLGAPGYTDYWYQALANARLVGGTTMCAAIGNSGALGANQHGSPGNYDTTIGVGAIDSSNDVATFSDWGTVQQHGGIAKPDFCAPGVDVISSVPGMCYAAKSGTSMSAPVATGAVALLLQKTPALFSNALTLTNALLACVTPLGAGSPSPRGGKGRLDLTSI
jgi:subtilisin family serine protease